MGTGMQVAQLLAKALGLDKRAERQLIVFFAGLDKVRAMIRDVSGHTPHIKDFYAESASLGLIEAEEFRSGNANQPGNGFTGGRFGMGPSNTGFAYSGVNFFLVGVANDVAQAGISLNDGKMYAGAGAVKLDAGGIVVSSGEPGVDTRITFLDSLGANAAFIGSSDAGELWVGSSGHDVVLYSGVGDVVNYASSGWIFLQAGGTPLNRLAVNQTETHLNYDNTSGVSIYLNGAVVINDSGANQDFRVEGDTDANLLFVDAGADRVGIGTATPAEKLDVVGNIKSSGTIEAAGGFVGTGWISNAIINGGFDFAQRQAPGTLTTIADNGYGPDRWRITRENADVQYIRQNALGESGLTSVYYGQFKKITNAGKLHICQIVEGGNSVPLRGKDVTFQIKMKSSASLNMRMGILELQTAGTIDAIPGTLVTAFGADGTDPTLGANVAVITGAETKALATSWQTFSVTVTVPANSKNVILAVWSDGDLAANATVSLAEADFFVGAAVRYWAAKPREEDIAGCLRYYEKSYNPDIAPGTATDIGSMFFQGWVAAASYETIAVSFKAQKRSAPTMTSYDRAGTLGKATLWTTTTPTNGDTWTWTSVGHGLNGTYGFTTNASHDGAQFQWIAEAEL